MKWAGRLIGSAVCLFWAGVCLRMLLPAFQGGEAWSGFAASLEANRYPAIAIAMATILGLGLWLLTAFALQPKPRYLSYETEHGAISISLKALQDFLANLKGEFPAIIALAPVVGTVEDGLDIVLEVKVRAGSPIPEMSRLLQDRVRALVNEKVGVADIRRVEVRIEEIVKENRGDVQEVRPTPPTGDVP